MFNNIDCVIIDCKYIMFVYMCNSYFIYVFWLKKLIRIVFILDLYYLDMLGLYMNGLVGVI